MKVPLTGPKGVACAFVPVTLWSVHGTAVSFKDIVATVSRPLIASMVTGAAALTACSTYGRYDDHLANLARLIIDGLALTTTYLLAILYAMG